MGWTKEQGDQFEENVKVNAALSALRKKGFNATVEKPNPFAMTVEHDSGGPVVVFTDGTRAPILTTFPRRPPFDAPKSIREFTVTVCPMGAPRMTRRDRWKKRPIVERYFAFRDVVRATVGDLPVVPDRLECTFYFPMPPSWSKKKHLEMAGKPHRVRPDKDNAEKGLLDSLFMEDGGVWSGEQHKYWCKPGEERIEITMIWL